MPRHTLKKFDLIDVNQIKQRINHARNKTKNSTDAMEHLNLHKAGVLVAIFNNNGYPYVVLTLRSNNLRRHKGQVALPGGKYDKDDRNIIETALRESEEEIGLNRENLCVLGILPPHYSIPSRVIIYPVLALLSNIETVQLKINKDEVEDVFAVPLELFMVADFHKKTNIEVSPGLTINTNVFLFLRNHTVFGDNDVSFLKQSHTHETNKEFAVFGLTAVMCLMTSMLIFNDLSKAKFTEETIDDWTEFIVKNGEYYQALLESLLLKQKI